MTPKKKIRRGLRNLPSALTVANPVEYAPAVEPAPLTVAPSSSRVTAGQQQPKSQRLSETRQPGIKPATAASPAPPDALKAPSRETARTVGVSFVHFEPTARSVTLCGSFNDWSTEATPMTRGHDNHWQATVALLPGRYEYKFYVDGQWVPDLHAQENVTNEFGTLNSVIAVLAR
jgi:hypothetical protein